MYEVVTEYIVLRHEGIVQLIVLEQWTNGDPSFINYLINLLLIRELEVIWKAPQPVFPRIGRMNLLCEFCTFRKMHDH